jgi:CHAD domain-containing protein
MLRTRLKKRGAIAAPTPVEPPPARDGPEPPRLRPDDPAAAAIHAVLASGLHWLEVNAPAARAGAVEGVHHLRTTTRRLRTALDLFRDLTDPDWADRLIDELKSLAGALGAVRDLDVLRDRLAASAAELAVTEAMAPLFATLDARHVASSAILVDALQGERNQQLIASLVDSIAALPLCDDAWKPCRTALPRLVDRSWKNLKKPARRLEKTDPDEQFHEVRKRAKQARYAAECVQDALDAQSSAAAARFARRARAVQDVLGEHQDAVVAAAEIQAAATAHPDLGPFNFAAGRLLEREHRAAADSRDRFFKVWPALARKKLVRWLKP